MTNLSGVSYRLTAFHIDPIMDEGRHEHTWKITYYWPISPWRDKRAMQEVLREAVEAWAPMTEAFQRELPPNIWTEEDIARVVMSLLTPAPARIDVEREDSKVELWA